MDREPIQEKHDMSKEEVAEHHEASKRPAAQSDAGITLVPAPSDDPRDPLVRLRRSFHSLYKHTAQGLTQRLELVSRKEASHTVHCLICRLHWNSSGRRKCVKYLPARCFVRQDSR